MAFKWRYNSAKNADICGSKRYNYYSGKRRDAMIKEIESGEFNKHDFEKYPLSKRRNLPSRKTIRFGRKTYFRRMLDLLKAYESASQGIVNMASSHGREYRFFSKKVEYIKRWK